MTNPAHHGKRKPRGNGNPPAEHRWPKGVSGNPKGRPAAGAAVKEWLNTMQDWTRAELEAVMVDDSAPVVKVAAARIWLTGSSILMTSSGAPVAGSDIDRICDRTDSQPTKLEVTGANGGPVETKATHTFDHDRFADLYRSRTRGNPAGDGSAAADRN